jgi:anti-sigma regulatory factor (Ser/Thr protein kinase)
MDRTAFFGAFTVRSLPCGQGLTDAALGKRLAEAALINTVAINLPPEPESARRAREELDRFRESLDEASLIDLRLLVDELIVEALHSHRDGANPSGAPPIELRAELEPDRVRVAIAEGGGAYRLPSRRPEPGDAGFGLHLVQRLSDRWGMRRERDRATVWLEMLRNPPATV